ncbi:MAG: VOC family protein [Candidatus Eremiobacterota bacterium]
MTRLKNLFLLCRDLAATADFYQSVLGLEPVRHGSRSVELSLGEVQLHLHSLLSDEERSRYGLENPLPGPRPGVVVSLRVEPGLLHRVQACAPLRCGPLVAPWGDRLVVLEDPEGNLLELACPADG